MLDPAQLAVVATGPAEVVAIPLDRLMLSSLNVRKTERDADIAALAEDIAAAGLLTSLNVVPAHFTTGEAEADWADKFEVVAGGRRYQALQRLAGDGRLPADHPVPCMIMPREAARETSLSENLHRVAMNPADEFDAFAEIVAQAELRGDPDPQGYCARRFGVSKRHVAERLRLAALAPEILEALRKGAITLDSAKAYAGTEDRELQLKVFLDQLKPGAWRPHDPATVRSALRGVTLAIADPLVVYAGLAAYREAGGRTEVEMFMGADGEERVLDVPLVHKLVQAKAEAALAAHVKAEGWKQGLLMKGVGFAAKWPKAPDGFEKAWDYGVDLGELSKAERKRCIAVVAVAPDGDGLKTIGRFKPAQAAEERPVYTPPTDEERAAALRADRTAAWAARLAIGGFAGTRFEGKAFWPSRAWQPHTVEWEYADAAGDGDAPVAALVEVQIRVTAEEIAACREAAEARVAEIEAEEKAEQERRQTERAAREAAADDDDLDGEFDESDLDEDDEAA